VGDALGEEAGVTEAIARSRGAGAALADEAACSRRRSSLSRRFACRRPDELDRFIRNDRLN
jgi:hypothetical protein